MGMSDNAIPAASVSCDNALRKGKIKKSLCIPYKIKTMQIPLQQLNPPYTFDSALCRVPTH